MFGGTDTELCFIDEIMLKDAVMKNLTKDERKYIIEKGGIYFHTVPKLHLELKGIPRIEYLWEFTSLVILDMSSNLIEKIEGLDRLLNLTWLSLSFNRIEKIEGLENLKKLEVLNLTSNRISVIENLDALEKLQLFSIGNNLIEKLDNVLYLRRFKKLSTLKLSGNPVSEEDDYQLYIAALIPNLVYLDSKLLDEERKKGAFNKYQYLHEKIRAQELQQLQAKDDGLNTQDIEVFLKGSYLSKSVLKDDPHTETLRGVIEMAQELETYEGQMLELCTQIIEKGLAEHKQRETEINDFTSVQTQAMKSHQRQVLKMLADFEKQHKERVVELQQLSDQKLLKDKISQGKEEISKLSTSLLEMEFFHVGQMEDITKRLDNNLSDMVTNFIEAAQGLFAQCRELEDKHYETVKKISAEIQESMENNDLEEDMPDDTRMLFTDKDALNEALKDSHDNHMLLINGRETQLLTCVRAWKMVLIKGIQDEETKWSGIRIADVHRYREHLNEALKLFI